MDDIVKQEGVEDLVYWIQRLVPAAIESHQWVGSAEGNQMLESEH